MSQYLGSYITTSYSPFFVPDAPGNVVVSDVMGAIYFTFVAPNQGGSAITAYTAVAVSTTSGVAYTGTTTTTSGYIIGVPGGQSYVVQIYAQNSYGSGAYSKASSPLAISSYASPSTVSYLIVAGGGSGGGEGVSSYGGGGGGAGGYRASTVGVSAGTPYAITVGAGAASVTGTPGANGSSSSAFSVVSTGGGGGGGGYGGSVGSVGGSGGGGGTAAGGAGTSGQGFAGGAGNGGSGRKGGGGGGASAVGTNASTTVCGNGGAGSNWLSLGTFYAGGGGGAGAATGGTGGTGGGGAKTVSGTVNTGGGGGGAGTTATGAGGSGIVIFRYATTEKFPVSLSGNPTITFSGGYVYFKFTGSGSVTW